MNRQGWLAASCAVLLLFVAAAFGSAWRKPVGEGFDEVAHVSFAAALQRRPAWPDLDALRMLDPVSFAVTAEPNYLNHPPLFYGLIAALGPRITDHPGALFVMRLIDIAIAAAGLVALLVLGRQMGIGRAESAGFAIFIAATPVLAPLAGSVNNDNLGFAGGGLALVALHRFLQQPSRGALCLACGGLLLASAAKLTGFMLIGGTLVAALLLAARLQHVGLGALAVAAAAVLVASLPYLAFILQYGSPAPDTAAQQALLISGADSAGWSHQPRLSPVAYTAFFLASFGKGWLPTLAPLGPVQTALLAIPALLMALSLAGACVAARAVALRRAQPADVLMVAGTIAIIATLCIHIVFSYRRHLDTGWMMDAYPRYYLPLLAIVPIGVLRLADSVSGGRAQRAVLALLIAGPIAFMLLQAVVAATGIG